jgi:hypothetical protein
VAPTIAVRIAPSTKPRRVSLIPEVSFISFASTSNILSQRPSSEWSPDRTPVFPETRRPYASFVVDRQKLSRMANWNARGPPEPNSCV